MTRLEINLRVLTPAFVRGAAPSLPELRAPSIKGLLRWWYRAWNPKAYTQESPWAEGRIMGSTRQSEGQCPFTLRVYADAFEPIKWTTINQHTDRGSRTNPGGVRYLGFSLGMAKNHERVDHWAIPAGTPFKVVHLFRDEPTFEQVQGLLAAWWLLAHLGGLGTRSRRGFGALVLESWHWPEHAERLEQLPLPSAAGTPDTWSQQVLQGLDVLKRWAPSGQWPATAPNLGPGSQVVLRTDDRWRDANATHEDAGRTLSAGRRTHRGDYKAIEDRVTFGLPLTTGKGSQQRTWSPGSFRSNPIHSDRHASPLHLHISRWRGGFGQCWALLAGPRPGIPPYRVACDQHAKTVREPAQDAVAYFIGQLRGPRWEADQMTSTILNLDAQQTITRADLPEALRRKFSDAEERRYTALGGPKITHPVPTLRVDWPGVTRAVDAMAQGILDADQSLIIGRAPLPVFAWLGFRATAWARRVYLANQHRDRHWDVIDLEQPGDPLFPVKGLIPSQKAGVVAVYVSVMGEASQAAIEAYFAGQQLKLAGLVSLHTHTQLTTDNAPGAAHQLTEVFSELTTVFPNQQGIALFVAGPASLAFVAGRAINAHKFAQIHLPNFDGGAYLPAIVHGAKALDRAALHQAFVNDLGEYFSQRSVYFGRFNALTNALSKAESASIQFEKDLQALSHPDRAEVLRHFLQNGLRTAEGAHLPNAAKIIREALRRGER